MMTNTVTDREIDHRLSIRVGLAAILAVFVPLGCLAVTLFGGRSVPVPVDLSEGPRMAARTETLTYSTRWSGDASADAEAVITIDGEPFSTEAGSGVVSWTPTHNGTYVLTHRTMAGGVPTGETLTAEFSVVSRFVEPGDTFEFTPEGAHASFTVEDDWVISNGVANVGDEVSVAARGLNRASGKFQGGNAMFVWQDYVAGTDPADENSRLICKISMCGTTPLVTWEPDLGEAREYMIWGRETLDSSSAWQWPTNALHRFFNVTVEMGGGSE